MRPLRTLASLACLIAVVQMTARPEAVRLALRTSRGLIVRPGPQDVLYAAIGDANYRYGPTMAQINDRLAAVTANSQSATFQVTYDNSLGAWPANAQAAFQAAVNIWQTVVTSPANISIKVIANFDGNFSSSSILGEAGPAGVCQANTNPSNTLYAAALANDLNGNTACNGSFQGGPGPYQITAHFNSSFPNWDFGTTGTPVPGKYSFQTVVLHEVGHGLGFYGSMQSASGVGSHFYDTSGSPGFVDVWDRFIVIGGAGGSSILGITSPSAALHAQLTGNNLFFSGPSTNGNNNGQAGKIEAHNFTTAYGQASDNGWLQGSSYDHLDDLLYSPPVNSNPAPNQYPNGLMTWRLNTAEVYTDPGPIMRGIFADEGWAIQGQPCTYSISPTAVTVGSAASNGSVTLTTQTGCAWTANSNNTGIATITTAASGTGSTTVNYNVLANSAVGPRSVSLTIGGQTFTITQNGTGPTMTLDRTTLVFAGVNNGSSFTAQTTAQAVRMTQSGAGTVSWTASSNAPWLAVAPTVGSGSAIFTVSTQFVGGLAATQTGSITITLSGAGNLAGPITVTLNSIAPSNVRPPFGSFDTPANGVTGVSGSIAVTGWTLDAVQATRTTVCRDAVSGEAAPVDSNCAGNAGIYIGDAVFIDGARPDVQALNPTVPLNSRAGWGYLLLTNTLPNLGNGTFNLRAYAFDAEGLTTALGVKTITCANNSSVAPFGAIDTPGQGAAVNGSSYNNFGWVLARTSPADPPDGGTVNVFVDGNNVGSPAGWTSRSDLTALFPAYPGIGKALAVFGLDTTTLTNGVHTIYWVVTGTNGTGTSGIGSRFFTVSNGNGFGVQAAAQTSSQVATVIAARSSVSIPPAASFRIASGQTLASEVAAAAPDLRAVRGRRGFDLDVPLRTYTPSSGAIDVQAEELDRIELQLTGGGHHQYTGYLKTAGGLRPLPVGSSLDASTGTFTWMPGVGFYGTYDLTFVRWSGGSVVARQDVRITLNAKGSNRVGPQTVIDAPTSGASVSSPFFVGGWAADLDSGVDSGVSTVHVWAYPVDASGNHLDPIFIGPAAYGGARSDVSAVYGDRFGSSGYGIVVNSLPAGTYDIAVFAFSTVSNTFTPARVVHITVK